MRFGAADQTYPLPSTVALLTDYRESDTTSCAWANMLSKS